MQRLDEDVTLSQARVEAQAIGLYLYCVADSSESASLGRIGLEGEEVFTIPWRNLCAVVHRCPAEPYQSKDEEVVENWVLTHQKVVDTAWERWGTVLPSTFDTIIQGKDGENAEQTVKEWLTGEYDNLKGKMARLRSAAEYGVQILWDPEVIGHSLAQTNQELAALQAEMMSKPKGTAFMYQEKVKKLLRGELEVKAEECFRDFYRRIEQHILAVVVEKPKKAEKGQQMILNLSCLTSKRQATELGEELEHINKMAGFSVRFTGPWPPYSFAGGA